jgi:hypothetical protein
MLSIPVAEVFASLDAAVAAVGAIDWDRLPALERLDALERLETIRRRHTTCSHDITGSLDRNDDGQIGPALHKVIADVLRISPTESRRRLRDAAQLHPRTTLTGAPMPPELPATATAWAAGTLDIDHLRVIQKFIRDLPDHIAAAEVEKAEAFLAEKAGELRPDQLERAADRLALTINPDGTFSDTDRARKRGFTWCGRQGPDGMSTGRLIATPELRALLEAWCAKFVDLAVLQREFRWASPLNAVMGLLPRLIASGSDPFAADLPLTGFPAVAVQPIRHRRILTDEFLTTIAREYLARGRGYATSLAQEYFVTPRTVVSWVEKARTREILSPPATPGATGGRLLRSPTSE